MRRGAEVRSLLALSGEEVGRRAGNRLVVCEDIEDLHRRTAEIMADELAVNARAGRATRWIVPVGPVGQYPHFVRLVRGRGIDLARLHLFFMDEYCDEAGAAFPAEHPLSFKGTVAPVLEELHALGLPQEQVVFPDPSNVKTLSARMAGDGGLDTCFAGVGIHGHLAFNEPEPGVASMGARRVALNDFTVTINAVRAHVGGNLENFPRQAVTVGLADILAARRRVILVRNGCEFDWANTVLRLALFGEPGDDYPVTHVRGREYTILTDRETLASPSVLF